MSIRLWNGDIVEGKEEIETKTIEHYDYHKQMNGELEFCEIHDLSHDIVNDLEDIPNDDDWRDVLLKVRNDLEELINGEVK